ncbi:MAG TPA: sugar phosphate isomerase/epimerase family protein [Chthoniobacteraceae bacterium]|nr:sugar phosphate isomerase/epimerase family protein [Chthoniobacteraceae bacterium]
MPLAAFPKCYLDQMCVEKSISVDQWIEMVHAELDVDGLEFYSGFTPDDDAELARIRAKAESLGLSIPMMCYSPDFTQPDAAARAREVEKEKRVIEITAQLGGKLCRVLSGQRRPELPIDEGVRLATECITSLLPHAEKCGVTLILENHYKDGFWQFPEFAQKHDVFLKLLNAIPEHPNFGVNYDPSNAIIAGDDPIKLLDDVKRRVVSMHASDRYFEGGTIEDLQKLGGHTGYASILKHGIIGRGLNDYDVIFSKLAGVGFKGWISIEDGADPDVGMEHLRLSAEFLRAKMKQHGLE